MQEILAVFSSLLTHYCDKFTFQTAWGSSPICLAVGELSELVLELQIFDIISLKASGICSIFPAFLPHSIIKFANSKIL